MLPSKGCSACRTRKIKVSLCTPYVRSKFDSIQNIVSFVPAFYGIARASIDSYSAIKIPMGAVSVQRRIKNAPAIEISYP